MKLKSEKIRTLFLPCAALLVQSAAATGNIASSELGTGLTNLTNDVLSFLLILCPSVAGAMGVYYLIRRGLADEQDSKMWMRRFITAIGCGAGAALVVGMIKLVASYF